MVMAQAMAIYLVSGICCSRVKKKGCGNAHMSALLDNDGQYPTRCNNPEILLYKLLMRTICPGKIALCGDIHFTGVPLRGQPQVACT
jgi:hypothetical protein